MLPSQWVKAEIESIRKADPENKRDLEPAQVVFVAILRYLDRYGLHPEDK